MKSKKIFLVFLCAFMALSVFAQEAEEIEIKPFNNFNLILHKDSFIEGYTLYGGEKISNSQVTKMLSTVPENKKLMNQKLGWDIAGYSLLGLGAAAAVMELVNTVAVDNEQYKSIANPVCAVTSLVSCIAGLFAVSMSSTKKQKAVDNYNLYVMGIPIE